MEAVQPIELEIPSLRIVLESKLPEAEWVRARYDALVLLVWDPRSRTLFRDGVG